ncbi:MAG: hypothetical protein H8Z69_04550 [Nanohaloarchaea archaeon]|nr:hypothetical protein [Candidatus Nanohaloarchaea archaeon]
MTTSETMPLEDCSNMVKEFVDRYMVEGLEPIPRDDLNEGDLIVLHSPYHDEAGCNNSAFEFGFYNPHHPDEEADNADIGLEGSFYALGRFNLWNINSPTPELDLVGYYSEININQSADDELADLPQTPESTEVPFPNKQELKDEEVSENATQSITEPLGIQTNHKWRTELYTSKSLDHRLELVDRGWESDYLTRLEDEDREYFRTVLESLIARTEVPIYVEHI